MTEINERDEYIKKVVKFHWTLLNDELFYEWIKLGYIEKQQFDEWQDMRKLLIIDNYEEENYFKNKKEKENV